VPHIRSCRIEDVGGLCVMAYGSCSAMTASLSFVECGGPAGSACSMWLACLRYGEERCGKRSRVTLTIH